MRVFPALPLAFLLVASLSACAHNTDSIAKLNEIPFGGTNAANIAAMVVNPRDLVRGHGGGPVDAAVSAAPIERFELDHTKSISGTGGGGSGGTSGGTSGGAGGGASGG